MDLSPKESTYKMNTPAYTPVGTLVLSINGEYNTTAQGDVHTGPNAEGYIENVLPEQETCYSVVFPGSGVAIWLTISELNDDAQYTVGRPLVDGEVLGLDRDKTGGVTSTLLQWDGHAMRAYVSGETLQDYGVENLLPHEAERVTRQRVA